MSHLKQNLGLIATALVAIFLCGGGSGYVIASLGYPIHPAPPPPAADSAWAEEALERLTLQLGLDPEQRAAVAPLIADSGHKISDQRERALFQIQLEILATHDSIAPHLDPSQQALLAKSRKNLHNHIYSQFSRLLESSSSELPAADPSPEPLRP